jgi:two-component system, LytTR family, response regulator
MVIQTLIADDEVLARRKLRQLLSEEPDIRIAGEGSTALEIVELTRAAAPHLLFLDVQMPGMNGMNLIKALGDSDDIAMPQIIFTTPFDRHALQAFGVRPVDYLLKPFTAERLRLALDRARSQLQVSQKSAGRGPGHDGASPYASRIVFKSRGRILFLTAAEIQWIAAEENYVRICVGATTHLLRETLTSMEKRLDPSLFMRVHRSAIVNLQYVREVRTEARGDYIVQLKNGQKVPMSRSYHARIDERLATA